MSRNPDIHRARKLRQSANKPENTAWQALRTLRKYGYPVRRQHPIGGYIADFAIIKARLVIEIDGGVHDREAARVADTERQKHIEALGWTVLRISAEYAMDSDCLFRTVSEKLEL